MDMGTGEKSSIGIGRLLRGNWAVTWRFQALFIVVSVVFMGLVTDALLRGVLALEGVSSISSETLGTVATHPLTWVYLIVIVLAIAILCLFEASALIYIFDASRQGRKTDLRAVFGSAWSATKRIFANRGRNLSMIVVMAVLLPVLGMGAMGTILGGLRIPEFIMEAIWQNKLFSAALIAVAIVVVIFLLRWCLALHFFVLEGATAREARAKSVAIGWKDRALIALGVIAQQLVLLIIAVAVIFLAALAVAAVYLGTDLQTPQGAACLGVAFTVACIVAIICFTVLLCGSTLVLSAAYYRYKARTDEALADVPVPEHRPSAVFRVATWVVVALLACGCAIFSTGAIYLAATEGTSALTSAMFTDTQIEITAHRGGSHAAPENTMAAFRTAAEQGADWCELDVQMSSDGVLFIMHDTNFLRTCGKDANTWELTWAEIQQLDASNGWEQYAGEHVPSFEEVIVWAKEAGMKLNIEIKPNGNEPSDLQEAVVNMVNAQGFADRCWIASLDYDVLKRVKEVDPTIPTLLNMVVAYGDISSLEAADNFSVESSNLSEDIVENAHAAGKKLAVWTVNDTDIMTEVMMEDIDNIVTDEVVAAQSKRALLSATGIAKIMEQASAFKQSLQSNGS